MSYSDQPPPPPPPPPGYGAPPPGYGGGVQPPKKSVMAIIALVTGIIGVIPCFWGCFVFSIAGVVLGILGKKEIRESNGMKTGDGQAQWGLILGIIGLVLGLIYWILIVSGVIDLNYYSDFNS